MRERARLAAALADAFLAGDWTPLGLRSRAARMLGTRHAWVRRMVREVADYYPQPPSDRPRELARFVELTASMAQVELRARRGRRPFPAAAHRITTSVRMVRRPFETVTVDHAGDLAALLDLTIPELLWFADTKRILRRSDPGPLHHYRSTWVGTRTGVRLLEAPLPRLKTLQRRILERFLDPIPVHAAAHGFVAGRSAITGAGPHVGAATVISLDLESFFSSVNGRRIYGILRMAGFPEPVAHLLTGLCTQATPTKVLSAMPTGSPSAHRLRRRLAEPHLPQGAPTSPQLANLAAFGLDRRLAAYACAIGATYTRYADDLTLSGPDLQIRQRGVIAAVGRIVAEEGFLLNAAKTRVRSRAQRQSVTGIVVNSRTTVPREEYDRLRAILHNCLKFGPGAQNRLAHNDFRAHLGGRIAWVTALDPERGRRLRADYDDIDWN